MGNSNITLQQIVDSVSIIGDLQPVLTSTGGFADEPALTIANDVVGEMFSVRFPWKWNRMKIPPFPLTTLQQDYASINLTNLGWAENGKRVDVNNTQVPQPDWPLVAVRDLKSDSAQSAWPSEYCWFPNDQLEQGAWPGPGVKYTWPIGVIGPVENPFTNILDIYGNILVLTQWGTTGVTPPAAVMPDPSDADYDPDVDTLTGQVIEDGTCEWTVANPQAQGFRFSPRPPSGGNVWLARLFAQKKAPYFINLQQKLEPIPDDNSQWFRKGFIAFAHRYSTNPNVTRRYAAMRQEWLDAVMQQARQGDREDESKGFFPDRGIAAPGFVNDPGPHPYRWGWR
jgi:hypothetical protein